MKMELKTETGTKELEVTPATGRKWDHEVFQFAVTEWKTSKLWDLVTEGREVHTVEISEAHKMINSILGVGLTSREDGMTGEQYAMSDHVDIRVPILLAQWTLDPDKGLTTMIVDGWSRIAKAYALGFRELPCYLITEEEVAQVGGIYDPIREKREDNSKQRAALAEMFLDLLDNMDTALDSHKWRKFRELDLLWSDPVDDLAELVESWKNGDKDLREYVETFHGEG